MNLELSEEEISTLTTIPEDDMVSSNTTSKKRNTDGQPRYQKKI